MPERKELEKSQDNQAAAPHADSVLAATKTLIGALAPEERQWILGELAKAFQPTPEPKPEPKAESGDVLAVIIRLLPERRSWTVEEIRKRVKASGLKADPKVVYNALTYLKRRNDIVHHGYGRYTVEGMHFVTSEEAWGTPTPHEQHDVET
jgi:hypothetical protein